MSWFTQKALELPSPDQALPGRTEAMPVAGTHAVLGTPLTGSFEGKAFAMFGLGAAVAAALRLRRAKR